MMVYNTYPQGLPQQDLAAHLTIAELDVVIPTKGRQASQQPKQHTAHAEHVSRGAYWTLLWLVEVAQTFWACVTREGHKPAILCNTS